MVLSLYGVGSASESSKDPDGVSHFKKAYPLCPEILNEQTLKKSGVRFFSDRDLDKYRINKLGITEQCLRSVIPVGIGIGLIFVSGPLACIPIAVGIGHSIKAFVDSIKRKKIKNLIVGSLLYLKGVEMTLDKKEEKSLNSFKKFYLDTREKMLSAFSNDASEGVMKAYLASRLLLINRFGFLISNRFNFDPGVRKLVKASTIAHPAGKYSKGFLKKHIVPLIIATEKILADCPADKLETLAFGHPE